MKTSSELDIRVKLHFSPEEIAERKKFHKHFEECPIPVEEMLPSLGLFMNRQTLSRIIFMHDLYQKILDVNGIVVEFGVRWGQNLALFSSFRGMYEPFNYSRKIVGFDTFSGFPSVSAEDGDDEIVKEGSYSVTEGYEEYLEGVLSYHESESPLNHIKKFELIKGDATKTLKRYLDDHPETIIALAYFDFDLYEPTKKCLELIQPYITRGTVLGFDQLNWSNFPGETVAVREVIGLDKFALKRSPLNPGPSYLVVD